MVLKVSSRGQLVPLFLGCVRQSIMAEGMVEHSYTPCGGQETHRESGRGHRRGLSKTSPSDLLPATKAHVPLPPPPTIPLYYESTDEDRAVLIQSLPISPTPGHCCPGNHAFNTRAFRGISDILNEAGHHHSSSPGHGGHSIWLRPQHTVCLDGQSPFNQQEWALSYQDRQAHGKQAEHSAPHLPTLTPF